MSETLVQSSLFIPIWRLKVLTESFIYLFIYKMAKALCSALGSE